MAFRDAALKDWGGADLEDVAAGARYLQSLPYVDPERLVVFGGSYGGYMTFMAVTRKPDLWRAGVAWVGITDLRRMYDQSMEHFKYFLREQMGTRRRTRPCGPSAAPSTSPSTCRRKCRSFTARTTPAAR